jgi:membrane protease YdiL (CAAX protease family)
MLAAASAGGASPLLLAGAVAFAPAVVEELLFRGLLLAALLTRLGRIDAVAVCGAFFAAIHLDPSQFFPLAVLGFAAGAVAVASGSVWPAVALHAAYNLTGLALGLALVPAPP